MYKQKHSMRSLPWGIKHQIGDNAYWVVKQTKTVLGTL